MMNEKMQHQSVDDDQVAKWMEDAANSINTSMQGQSPLKEQTNVPPPGFWIDFHKAIKEQIAKSRSLREDSDKSSPTQESKPSQRSDADQLSKNGGPSQTKEAQAAPDFWDVSKNIFQAAWNGFTELQRQYAEHFEARSEEHKDQTERFSRHFFNTWRSFYDKEFKRYFYVPQLGLTRFYQERVNHAADKFIDFQTMLGEFLNLLTVPIENSNTIVQKKLAESAKSGKIPESSKDLYQMWIKVLESQYLDLFKSTEYVHAQNRTLEKMEDFMSIRQNVIQDFMKMLAVPTQNEMDDLYKELYVLKKRMRTLEKRFGEQLTQTD